MELETKKDKARRARLKKLFNISPEDYSAILAHQNGGCYVCSRPPGKTRLAVDHCHKTGLIRGLLCNACNRAIAKFRDNPTLLQRAADYLRSPPATAALNAPRYGLKGRVTNKAATRKRLNKPATTEAV